MVEYTVEFQELQARNNLNEIEAQIVLGYVTGLTKPLRSKLDVRNVLNFPDAITMATKFESQLVGQPFP